MNPDKIEIPYAAGTDERALWYFASVTVEAAGIVHIDFPSAGNAKLTEQGWDDLVQRVNEAFVGEPKVELEIGYRDAEDAFFHYEASQEMVDALSKLPTETLYNYPNYTTDHRDRCWECGQLEPEKTGVICPNCGLDSSEGHAEIDCPT